MMKNNFLTQLLGVKRHIYEKYLKKKAKKKTMVVLNGFRVVGG